METLRFSSGNRVFWQEPDKKKGSLGERAFRVRGEARGGRDRYNPWRMRRLEPTSRGGMGAWKQAAHFLLYKTVIITDKG